MALKADGLDRSFLVDERQGEILAAKVARSQPQAPMTTPTEPNSAVGDPDLDRRVEAGIEALGEQERRWARCPGVPREMVGVLLALLGDHPRVRDLAED
jgi:hypothetical protein